MAPLSAHLCQLTSLRDAQCMFSTPQPCLQLKRIQQPARRLQAHRHHTPQRRCAADIKRQHCPAQCCQAAGSNGANVSDGLYQLDANQLQTVLQIAVDSEDFARAGTIRDELNSRQGGGAAGASWQQLGVPDWLADRAEQLGLRFPTGKVVMQISRHRRDPLRADDMPQTSCHALLRPSLQVCHAPHLMCPTVTAGIMSEGCEVASLKTAEVQSRAAEVVAQRRDCIVQSETGSGKTLSFLMPVLSALDYPPQTPLEDFQVTCFRHGVPAICEFQRHALCWYSQGVAAWTATRCL